MRFKTFYLLFFFLFFISLFSINIYSWDYSETFAVPYNINATYSNNIDLTLSNYQSLGIDRLTNSSRTLYLLADKSSVGDNINIWNDNSADVSRIRIDSVGATGNEGYGGIMLVLSDAFSLTANSSICFYHKDLEGEGEQYLTFSDITMTRGFAIALRNDFSEADGYHEIRNNFFDRDLSLYTDTIYTNYYCLNFTELTNYNTYYNYSTLQYLLLEIGTDGGTNSFVFGNLTMLNLENNTNTLPNVELSYNSTSLCIDEEQSSVTFDFVLDVDDSENDKIYYSFNEFDEGRYEKYYSEDFAVFRSGELIKDRGFFTNGYYKSNYSTVDNQLEASIFALSYSYVAQTYMLDMHYMRDGIPLTNEITNEVFTGLTLLSTQDWLHYFIIDLKTPYVYDIESEYFLFYPDDKTHTNFLYLDDDNQIILNISINITDGVNNFNAYLGNQQIANFDLNRNNLLGLYVILNKSDNSSNIRFIDGVNDVSYRLSNISITTLRYLGFETIDLDTTKRNQEWYISSMYLRGSDFIITPTWSDIIDTSLEFDEVEENYYEIYISDEVNKITNNYITKSFTITISRCEDTLEEGIKSITSDDDIRNFVFSIKTMNTNLCSIFDNSGLGNYGKGNTWEKFSICSLMNIFYLLFAGIVAFVFFIMFRSWDVFVLSWGVTSLFGTMFFEFSLLIKVFIAFAILIPSGKLIISIIFGKVSGVTDE